MTIMKVRDLSKSFGGIEAVRKVSFELKKGEFLALIGPNGAGKSTCFNMINGYLKPDSGSVELAQPNGKWCNLVGRKPRAIWRYGVGRTFQITATFASMTVRENVQMALISHYRSSLNIWVRATRQYNAEADQLLEMVSMQDLADRACSELAYGDLKRLELAIALAHAPRLLLMDEPTAGMAPSERDALMSLVADIVHEEDLSVMFTEHDMDVVFEHADRILVLNRGELIAQGDEEEIRTNKLVQEVYLGGGSVFGDAPKHEEESHAEG
ncbi:ABC transporter ATP-binding protein [Cohaesibacter gelatinilyticus]|uniref:Amino acid/amide ABC transporter ATP-binding protein 1, HAAT family n=1 Tax=Cohaesibacter gelatinilyticus TaxID=372072 RepID=A0A285NAS8_9HYPH|nr:ABC transporter ATP-binding protein [Cohaesibacter gelatinilyticus]SNZ06572.1 amino acid/amide ABC transporter ATP-binding protein 1, HAAT family [Cohaesibacter gelatinilyticus]